ncbi:MAG: ABC transporter ATP-binding protein [Alphaproteobacteria bacterium]|nr:ABC transporter ATP-binding protein [Alphaproteobacteria bacterium]
MSKTVSPPLLTVSNLRKTFGGVVAVRDVSFDVRLGQMVALIGANGAGKTTSFNCINGQLRPDGGSVIFNPKALTTKERIALEQEGELDSAHRSELHDITGRNPRRIARMGIGRTFQITATFASMTVAENIQVALIARRKIWTRLWGRASNYARKEALRYLDMVGLADQADHHCATLAYGDLKRLELAMALAGKPRLLLMDEPTAGMGIHERDDVMQLAQKLARDHHIGVLFTEHDTSAVFNYADWIIVMHNGEVIARGDAKTIKANQAVRDAYLGNGQA